MVNKIQTYSFIDKTLDADYESRPIKAANVSGEKKSDLLAKDLDRGNTKSFVIDYNATRITDPSDFIDDEKASRKEAKIISLESYQNNKIAL